MEIVLVSLAFLSAALCAGIMGFAIQRGATCTVAAVNEVVNKRRINRLASIVDASVWVAGGLLLAQMLHVLGRMPAGYQVGYLTILGGMLLGLGAFINGACVFGAIARLGSGQWAYFATPLGFYVGCLTVGFLFAPPALQRLPYDSFVLHAPAWLALLFVAFVLWRLGRPLFSRRPDAPARQPGERVHEWISARVWSPHAATTVIGITFFFTLLLVGAWSYTDVLMELARTRMAGSLIERTLLLVALLLGAIWGGWTAGLFRSTRISLVQVIRCFIGGMLMGWGSLLIPGGNDGLILVGMPLLWPYAWIAFATMFVTIGVAVLVRKALISSVPEQRV